MPWFVNWRGPEKIKWFHGACATVYGRGTNAARIIPPALNGYSQDSPRAQFDEDFTGSRMVTNSSATVGWMPMVLSNWALVAPAFMATANP